jgi:MraZ protein
VELSGTHLYLVDEKGRVAIPAAFKSELPELQGSRLFVTKFKRHQLPCLDVYHQIEWRNFLQKLKAKKQMAPNTDSFSSYYVGAAHAVEPDAQGRILIPPMLREFAQLKREVVIAGVNDKFRIWDKELYHQADSADERAVFDNPAFLEQLDL